jgi:pimeloyl-ACP methyl ester carboxylesterase
MDTRAEADTPDGQRGRDDAIRLARQAGSGAIADGMLPKIVADDATPETMDWVRSMMAATPLPGIVGALEAMKCRPDSTPLLPTLDMPALIVVGDEDQITPPEQARAMARAIPRAQLMVVPDAGHLPPVERPEVTTDALREFLRRLPNEGG